MDRRKEYFEEPLNVKCEKQMRGDEEEDIEKQKEEMRNEWIRIEEVTEAIHTLKRGKGSRTWQYNSGHVTQYGKCWLYCSIKYGRKKGFQKIGKWE